VWDQEEDIDALTRTGLQELVNVMGVQAIQQEQAAPRVPELIPSLCDRRRNTSLAHHSNKPVFMKAFSYEAGDTFELSLP
jgi:hypothetical protein